MSQHVCRHASRKNNSAAGHGWPGPLCRRQESPAKRRHTPAPVQVSKGVGKERSSWSDRPELSPSWRAASAGRAAAQPGAGASPRLVDRHIVLLRCCILLLYQGLELRAQDFEFISLTWVELRGFEPLTSCMP